MKLSELPLIHAAAEAATKIAPLPAVVLELLRSLEQENINSTSLSEKIGQDPPLSARVLRVVNSPFFGLPGQIASLPEAVFVLGFSNVRNLALAASLASFTGRHIEHSLLQPITLWQHSLASALTARILAGKLGVNADQAFTAALLLEIGRIAMLCIDSARLDQAMRQAMEQGIDPCIAEWQAFGFDHAELGEMLLASWNLPAAIVRAVARHHRPDANPDRLTDLVAVAHALAAHFTNPGAEHLHEEMASSLVRLGLTREECLGLGECVSEQLHMLTSHLHAE